MLRFGRTTPILLLLSALYLGDSPGAHAQPPEVIIHEGEERTIHEYQANGFTYAIKVIPKNGKPYFLVTPDGKSFHRADNAEELIPSWELLRW